METLPRFIKPREFAKLVGVDEETVRRAVKSGEVRAARLGARILIPVIELERLAAEAGKGDSA